MGDGVPAAHGFLELAHMATGRASGATPFSGCSALCQQRVHAPTRASPHGSVAVVREHDDGGGCRACWHWRSWAPAAGHKVFVIMPLANNVMVCLGSGVPLGSSLPHMRDNVQALPKQRPDMTLQGYSIGHVTGLALCLAVKQLETEI